MKRLGMLLLITLLTLTVMGLPAPVAAQDNTEEDIVQLVAQSEQFAEFLSGYDWKGSAWYEESSDAWWVDFNTEDDSEWLGYAGVNDSTGDIFEFFVPRPLEEEEYEAGKYRVERILQSDPEIAAILGALDLWYSEIDYNRYEANWEARFYRGVEHYLVTIVLGTDYASIEDIQDENALEAEDLQDQLRARAVEVAYQAEGLWETLDGIDDWRTYVAPHEGTLFSVTFVAADQELFYVLVDAATQQIIESEGS